MQFNINQTVVCRLTYFGLLIYSQSDYYRADKLELDGTLREQAWVIMRIFGKYLKNGGQQVFVDNVWTVEA